MTTNHGSTAMSKFAVSNESLSSVDSQNNDSSDTRDNNNNIGLQGYRGDGIAAGGRLSQDTSSSNIAAASGTQLRGRRNITAGRTDSIEGIASNSRADISHKSYKLWDFGSVYLKNDASVARDHLASERTFLAWLRTSLAFASVGVGITQLLKLQTDSNDMVQRFGKALGLAFIGTGIMTLFFGVARFFLVQQLLMEGVFPASQLFVGVLLVMVFIVSLPLLCTLLSEVDKLILTNIHSL